MSARLLTFRTRQERAAVAVAEIHRAIRWRVRAYQLRRMASELRVFARRRGWLALLIVATALVTAHTWWPR